MTPNKIVSMDKEDDKTPRFFVCEFCGDAFDYDNHELPYSGDIIVDHGDGTFQLARSYGCPVCHGYIFHEAQQVIYTKCPKCGLTGYAINADVGDEVDCICGTTFELTEEGV